MLGCYGLFEVFANDMAGSGKRWKWCDKVSKKGCSRRWMKKDLSNRVGEMVHGLRSCSHQIVPGNDKKKRRNK